MSEIVDRVAKAIEGSLNSDLENAWQKAARAAIAAMREPTQEMVLAAQSEREQTYHGVHRAMIDAALQEDA